MACLHSAAEWWSCVCLGTDHAAPLSLLRLHLNLTHSMSERLPKARYGPSSTLWNRCETSAPRESKMSGEVIITVSFADLGPWECCFSYGKFGRLLRAGSWKVIVLQQAEAPHLCLGIIYAKTRGKKYTVCSVECEGRRGLTAVCVRVCESVC